jgi:hypothetical protein
VFLSLHHAPHTWEEAHIIRLSAAISADRDPLAVDPAPELERAPSKSRA